ncbi:unnamed protein product, partial [Effrenium voratum]
CTYLFSVRVEPCDINELADIMSALKSLDLTKEKDADCLTKMATDITVHKLQQGDALYTPPQTLVLAKHCCSTTTWLRVTGFGVASPELAVGLWRKLVPGPNCEFLEKLLSLEHDVSGLPPQLGGHGGEEPVKLEDKEDGLTDQLEIELGAALDEWEWTE